MKKWNGSTDSGSQYFRLRSEGLSHDDAVAKIEGTPIELYDKGYRHYTPVELDTLIIPVRKAGQK